MITDTIEIRKIEVASTGYKIIDRGKDILCFCFYAYDNR